MHQYYNKRLYGLFIGLFVFFIILSLPENQYFDHKMYKVLASSILMITYWILEVFPIPITALLPIILFPLLDIMTIDQICAIYGNKIVFLMFSGFILGLALEKWQLNYRIALNILKKTGSNKAGILLGFMISSFFLSMWISNTATTIIMLPIALSFLKLNPKIESNTAKILMIAIAYAASIGGISTIIGTPTNAILVAHLEEFSNYKISFLKWFSLALPIALILFSILFTYLFYFFNKSITANHSSDLSFKQKLNEIGKITYEEKIVSIIFILLALSWSFYHYLPFNINASVIGLIYATMFFIIPAKKDKFILNWQDTNKLSWGTLILFGGGLAIAKALETSGLINLLEMYFSSYKESNIFFIIILIVATVILLTEFTSNLALISCLIPVISAFSLTITGHSFNLSFVATIAASCAFMLPMSTPPNAVIFSTGYLKVKDMVKIGLWSNLGAILLISLYGYIILNLF